MIRHVVLTGLLVLPLSCASSGSKAEESPGLSELSEGTHHVIYSVECLTPVRREGLTVVRDCEFEVSYAAANGTLRERQTSAWSYEFVSTSGEPARLTVERRGWTDGRVVVSIVVDSERTREFLNDGESGPLTLTADMP